MAINITFDKKRSGYHVHGEGFDFFAHFACNDPDTVGPTWLEADVQRKGDDISQWFQVALPHGRHSQEIVETLVVQRLHQMWDHIY